MPSLTIDQYRDAKSNYEKLRSHAKKELLARYQELAQELLLIQQELREDFGHKITMPTKAKSGQARKNVTVAPVKTEISAATPQLTSIERKLAAQKKKLAEAQAAHRPTKPIEDRIYELEDELRLAGAHAA